MFSSLSLTLLIAGCGQQTPLTGGSGAKQDIRILSLPQQVALVTLELRGTEPGTSGDSRTYTAVRSGDVATVTLDNVARGSYTLIARGYDGTDAGKVVLYKASTSVNVAGAAPIALVMNRITSAIRIEAGGVLDKSNVVIARAGGLSARLTKSGEGASGTLVGVPTGRNIEVLVEGRENGVLREQGRATVNLSEDDVTATLTLGDVTAAAPGTPVLSGATSVKKNVEYRLDVSATQDTSGGDTLRTLTVSWGDGTTETFPVSGASLSRALTHTYSAAGDQNVSVTVTNTAGVSSRADLKVGVVDTATVPVTIDVGPEVSTVNLAVSGVPAAADRAYAVIAPNGPISAQDLQDSYTLELIPGAGGSWSGALGLPLGLKYTAVIHAVTGSEDVRSATYAFNNDGRTQNVAFTYAPRVPECPASPDAVRTISEVQGSGAVSPLVGQTVRVRGVVVGDFQAGSQLGGVFIQDAQGDGDAATSDGLFVTGAALPDLNAGDLVQISGTVSETGGLTTLSATTVESCATGLAVTPLQIPLPLPANNDWERFEGMFVRTTGVVTETFKLGRGGSVTIADDRVRNFTQTNLPSTTGYAAFVESLTRRTLVVDDGSLAQNPAVHFGRDGQPLSAANPLRGGDLADVTGVLSFGKDGTSAWTGNTNVEAYRMHAVTSRFSGPARPTAPTDADLGNPGLRVASMNVLNYFNGNGAGGGFPTPRGATNAAELARQQDKIVASIVGLDADVIGLLEIENDFETAVPAIQTLVDALNARLGAGTYAAINPGRKIGTDQISVAMIYRVAAVTPVGGLAVLDNSFDPLYVDTCSRPTLAQTFRAVNGGVFTLVEAHLKSKGSACAAVPGDTDQLDGQGASNRSRTQAAQVMTRWLATNPTGIADSDYVIMGDINAYAKEDPIRTIEAGADAQAGTGDDYVNLFSPESYSYVFGGTWGSLDHAIASPTLRPQVTGSAKWHVNADEAPILDYNTEFKTAEQVTSYYAPTAYRSSDHDPLVIGLTLTPDADPQPAPTFNLTAPATVVAGETYTISIGTPRLAGGATVASAEVDWGDRLGYVALTATNGSYGGTRPTNPTADFTVTVRVTDSNGQNTVREQAVTVTPPVVQPTRELFISEYVEGSSNNKALEIYNPTDVTVDLSLYSLALYSNGAATGSNTLQLSGTLAAGATYVVVNPGAGAALLAKANVTHNVTFYNGDDAIALLKNGQAVDVFGQIGVDPGSSWNVNGVNTLDKTLRRKPGITAGDADGANAFDPSVQWDVFNIDTFDGLGSHTLN